MLAALIIDWTQCPTYNTIMSIAAGSGLMMLVKFARVLTREKEINLDSWAIAFSVPGFILTVTGIHMSLTWPMAKYFPYDNVIFGEPSFGFGVLLLSAALYLWRRREVITASGDVAGYIADVSRPLSIFIVGMGLALGAIAIAGLYFQLFAAPPEEPLTGIFAPYPWLEATFMSGMFGFVGIGAVLFPFAMNGFSLGARPTTVRKVVGFVWYLSGLGFFLFGALNFFTHIGLILHTMAK